MSRPTAKAPDWFRPTFRTEGNILICEGDAWDSKGEVCTFRLAAPVGDKFPEQVVNKENLRATSWEAVWLIAQDRSPFEYGGQHVDLGKRRPLG